MPLHTMTPLNARLASSVGVLTMIGGLAFWYGGGLVGSGRHYIYNGAEIVVQVFIFIFISFAAYWYSRSVLSVSRVQSAPNLRVERVDQRRVSLGVTALILTYAGLFLMDGSARHIHSVRFAQTAGIVAAVMSFSAVGAGRVLFAAFTIASLSLTLGAYSRRPVMTVLFAVIVPFLFSRKLSRVAIVMLAMGSVLVSIALLFMTGLRGLEIWTISDAPIILERGWAAISAGSGFDTIWLLDYVIQVYPNESSYLWGKSLIGALVNPIPRELWPTKPISFGVELAAQYFNLPEDQLPTNFGSGIVAEAYANGGPLMVAAWAAGLGYLVARFDVYVGSHSGELLGQLTLVIVPPALFFLIRGDLMNAFYEFYIKWVPAVIIAIYARRRYRPVMAQKRVHLVQ